MYSKPSTTFLKAGFVTLTTLTLHVLVITLMTWLHLSPPLWNFFGLCSFCSITFCKKELKAWMAP